MIRCEWNHCAEDAQWFLFPYDIPSDGSYVCQRHLVNMLGGDDDHLELMRIPSGAHAALLREKAASRANHPSSRGRFNETQ